MQRIPESELMDEPEQAKAYARADFSEPHNHFVALFRQRFADLRAGNRVLDLGCGPGDICRRFARAFPDCRIHAVDASESMLTLARAETEAQALDGCIEYFLAYLPDARLPAQAYDTLISNSLLHHLNDPATLWSSVVEYGQPGSLVFVMDLLRPDSREHAEQLLKTYAANEAEVLQKDFFNSLLAAYRPDEVRLQLQQQGLDQLQIEVVSDRHFIVSGQL
jgi:cyclopropane fatty-acyl-phospholipid synthase-like methyltransferase